MRHWPRLAEFLNRHVYFVVIPLLAIVVGAGCSDPPDPVPLQKLTSNVSSADRLVVDASGDYADPAFKPVEINGPDKAGQFLATLEFSSKRRFYHSPIHGEYLIQCFSNEQQLAAITLPGYRPAQLSWEFPDTSRGSGILKRSSVETLLGWLATNGCDILKREQAAEIAEKQRRLQAELNCVACFPAQVHDLFKPAAYGTEIPPWAAERGRKLAATINDPHRLTTMGFRAFGCLRDYSYLGEHEQILQAAMETISGPDLAAGLKTIQDDRAALFGASRFLFMNSHIDKLSETERDFWMATLSEVVLNDGQERGFPWVFEMLSRNRSRPVRDLLHRLARGETGKTYPIRALVKYDPLLRPSAFLCLAMQADAEIEPNVKDLLNKTTRPVDRTALELALALLAPTNHVRSEHFDYSSSLVEHATLEAVRRFPTLDNLDALVSGGVSRPEAADYFETFVNHHWDVGARFDGEIQRWWATHRDQFASPKPY